MGHIQEGSPELKRRAQRQKKSNRNTVYFFIIKIIAVSTCAVCRLPDVDHFNNVKQPLTRFLIVDLNFWVFLEFAIEDIEKYEPYPVVLEDKIRGTISVLLHN